MKMIEEFTAARRAATPLLAIRTPDPASTKEQIRKTFPETPIAEWDIIHGVRAVTPTATAVVNEMHTVIDVEGKKQVVPAAMVTGNPIEALTKCLQFLPDLSILLFHNAHMFAEKQGSGESHKPVIQAIWNLRDPFRKKRRTLVMLVPDIDMPPELKNDIMVIDEAYPTDEELAAIVVKGLSEMNIKKPGKKILPKIVDAVAGLSAFNAEQVVRMAVVPGKKRVNQEHVWEQKIKIIEQERGLRVHRNGPKFSDIGGNDNIKHLLLKVARGEKCPRLVVFIDEIEKAMQAAGTDTSGTTTDQLKVLLTEMQNNDWNGVIIYGFAGTGKSELAKAFGSEASCPTVEADLGSMKNKWVGSSEANMRAFVKTIKAMGSNRVFFVATCNQVSQLRPEFKRRFRKGIFFCDLPAEHERNLIWKIYLKKFEINHTDPRPVDEGWTGAEIRACCENAHEFRIPLKEAAKFMTITSQAMGKEVEDMRLAASGKYVDAQNPGVYQYEKGLAAKFQSFMKGDK